jgi:hypothetical protein
MKTKIILIAMMVLTSWTATANRETGGGMRITSSVYLVFTSFGAGTDYETAKYANTLVDAVLNKGLVKKMSTEFWGWEGETTRCVTFRASPFESENTIEAAQISREFIAALAPRIMADAQKMGQRTRVLLGKDCNDIEAATEQDVSKYL